MDDSPAVPDYSVEVESQPKICPPELLWAVVKGFVAAPRYYDRDIFSEYTVKKAEEHDGLVHAIGRASASESTSEARPSLAVEVSEEDMVLSLSNEDGCKWKYSIKVIEESCAIHLEVVMFSSSEEEDTTVDPGPLQKHVDTLSSIAVKVSFLSTAAFGGVQDILAVPYPRDFAQICTIAKAFEMMDPSLKKSPGYRVDADAHGTAEVVFESPSVEDPSPAEGVASIKTDAIEQLINDWKRAKDWKKPMEYMLTSMPSDGVTPPKPYYYANKVLDKLHEVDSDTYASYMIEGVKVPPLLLTENDIAKQVLSSLIKRRRTAEAALPEDVHVMSIPAFPTLGAEYTHRDDHLKGPTAESILVPDDVITPHVRFQTLTKSVRARKGAKSRDPLKDRVYLDATVFGFGQCCLQCTFEAPSLPAARVLHDQMCVLAPLFLALSAAAPFQRGMVTDVDARYELLSQCVDDRTVEEADPKNPEFKQQGRMPETIHRYISTSAPESMSDLVVEHREDQKQRLMDAGMDEVFADYFAYIFYRDPMIIFKERIHLDNDHSIEHFEGMHSTHWTIVRIKPPPAMQDEIQWRVELRGHWCPVAA
ncbi:hypothetical protein FOZ60_013930 [Perkinsus olseni]|uniref:Glutamate--cysteine ligase n=1 Tax=Perkinsus olseni TaxID=32597 RepID=A0A7J6P7Y2_PEROL|nr:hypothetical protein FOZ60_013930 [Perkinsus olseni]